MSVAADAPLRLTASCHRSLVGWSAPTPEQDELRLHYLRHLEEHPTNGWSRACVGAHLTASSLVCSTGDGQVLLTLHAKLRRWLQTGGHLEPDDVSLAVAAAREAREESGIDRLTLDPDPLWLSRHALSCSGQPTFHLDVQFLVTTAVASPPVIGEESIDVRWFSHHELPEVDTSVRELVQAAGRRLGWS